MTRKDIPPLTPEEWADIKACLGPPYYKGYEEDVKEIMKDVYTGTPEEKAEIAKCSVELKDTCPSIIYYRDGEAKEAFRKYNSNLHKINNSLPSEIPGFGTSQNRQNWRLRP